MIRWLVPVSFCVCAFSLASAQEGMKYAIKATKTPPPDEVSEPIRKLLADSSTQLMDGDARPICDIWFRKTLPADATPEQIKSGVTYREVQQTEILGAIQFHRTWTDYRKQEIKPGVYTMRLGYQPTDGKHNDERSEFREFAVVIGAKDDGKPGRMEAKELIERSRESLENPHPGVFMLWPNSKPGKEPGLASRPKNHWVLNAKYDLVVAGKTTGATIGVGLNLVGHSPAAE